MMPTLRFIGLCFAIFVLGVGSSRADDTGFAVSPNVQSMNFAAGEAQSAVVPPGKKSQCTKGRIFITDDWTRPGDAAVTGAVHWRDLSGAAEGVSIHDPVPNGAGYEFLTNDHDIVALPNGDVIYEIGAGSKRALTPAPNWFGVTYRGKFGPGARSTILVWRSEDCGKSFKFVSEIDSAGAGHEDCAYPQGAGVAANRTLNGAATAEGVAIKKQQVLFYDMGGTDGQWLGIDRQSGKLVLVEQCVGRVPIANASPFRLSGTGLSKTYVFTSGDGGSTWQQSAGSLAASWWRTNGVAVANNRLVLAIGASVSVGTKASNGNGWDFGPFDAVQSGAPGYAGMTGKSPWKELIYDEKKNPAGIVKYNIPNWWTLARVPDSNWMVLAAAELVSVPGPNGPAGPDGVPILNQQQPGTSTFGSGLYFYDPDTKKVKTAAPVVPANPTLGSAIMHLTVIDPGSGPVLLYWYDLDGGFKTAAIRGRFIFGPDQLSDDFEISRLAGNGSSFSLVPAAGPATPYWYGDYKTAGGFAQSVSVARTSAGPMHAFNAGAKTKYRYFPVWVEPDGKMYYTEVSVLVPGAANPATPLSISGLAIKPASMSPWRRVPRQATAIQVPWANDLEEQHERVRGPARPYAPVPRIEPDAPPLEAPPPAPPPPMRPLEPAATPRIQRVPTRPAPVAPAVETSTLCRFTSGPRNGETQDYAPMTPLPVGSACQDARGSNGVVVAR